MQEKLSHCFKWLGKIEKVRLRGRAGPGTLHETCAQATLSVEKLKAMEKTLALDALSKL